MEASATSKRAATAAGESSVPREMISAEAEQKNAAKEVRARDVREQGAASARARYPRVTGCIVIKRGLEDAI